MLAERNDMKRIVVILFPLLLVPISRSEVLIPTTPADVASNFIREVSALATNHTELAGFPEYVKQLEVQSQVVFYKNIKPIKPNTAPALTKRRILPSDFGTNGILLEFSLVDDRQLTRSAPIDTVTHLPNLKLRLYAEVVLWEKASPELKKQLENIIGRHKAMLQALDKNKAANKTPEDTARKLADPQR